jgi:hypothetical protein
MQIMTDTRATATIDFLGREVQVYEPSDTQKAVLAQIARSTRVELMTKVARLIDLMEAWIVFDVDRQWFSDNMLGGDWSFEDDVIPQIQNIVEAFAPEENREGRRAAKKAIARRPAK